MATRTPVRHLNLEGPVRPATGRRVGLIRAGCAPPSYLKGSRPPPRCRAPKGPDRIRAAGPVPVGAITAAGRSKGSRQAAPCTAGRGRCSRFRVPA